MESNIEARNSKVDSSYLHGNTSRYSMYPNNSSFSLRQNGSLPRKFNTNTSIPIRNDYYSYSHGKYKKLFMHDTIGRYKYSLWFLISSGLPFFSSFSCDFVQQALCWIVKAPMMNRDLQRILMNMHSHHRNVSWMSTNIWTNHQVNQIHH